MTQRFRQPEGGRIDRQTPLTFTFNGKRYQGYRGDTLASALLANNVHLVGRSSKYHRPRGIIGSGTEEPNALVQLEKGAYTSPNYLSTEIELYEGLIATSINCWPSLKYDFMAITKLLLRFMTPGFYYKTFMWPKKFWRKYEYFLRRLSGLGVSPNQLDPDRYDKINTHCDVLVVGGGPTGLAAALEAGRTGARVILADEQNEFGGTLLSSRETINDGTSMEWASSVIEELAGMEEVRLFPRSTVVGYYDHNFLIMLEKVTDHLPLNDRKKPQPRERLWKIRANQVVIATGAIERPLVFPNNDRPGVMMASAISVYLNRYGVKPGVRPVIFTNNDSAYQTALDLTDAGITIEAVVDTRKDPQGPLPTQARQRGITVFDGHVIVELYGRNHVKAVALMPLDDSSKSVTGNVQKIRCDVVAVSGGWNPRVHLHCQSGGKVEFDDIKACFIPKESIQEERSAGSCNGTFSLSNCISEGITAGVVSSHAAGYGNGSPSLETPDTSEKSQDPLKAMWAVPSRKYAYALRQFVDMQEDVTAYDIWLAVNEGYQSHQILHRYIQLGIGTDQGKLGNVNGMGILSDIRGVNIGSVGATTFRPVYTPITFGSIAGSDIGPELYAPIRKTPIHQWHVEAGAPFENVGEWKRPWYYPKSGETIDDAVNRECLTTRNSAGVFDQSTLGKIDIQGPDAAEFLNRVYMNNWLKLGIGRCRYGIMLGENGMVLDDGVTARLSENHFQMFTTTGGAATVMTWLENWSQTEWPELKVYFTSITDHWSTMSVVGPNARSIVSKLCNDIDLSAEGFPFMSFREGTVSGVPARIFRVSFTGESSFEINVNSNYGRYIWEAIMEAGEEYNITPWGTESTHLMRAEKAYLIVGQDTDGSVTPVDSGMDRMISKTKDFIGKRSLSRPDSVREDRKQLVGLLTEDSTKVLPEGGQITQNPHESIPAAMIGHVTSSYWSANLNRSIAMAVIKGGHVRMGEKVYIYIRDENNPISAIIANPVFYDPEGVRLHA